jgi:predicted SPOUT superfamily RNA methylase MTH1
MLPINPCDEFLIMLVWLQAAHHKAEEPNLFIGYALSHKASFKKATPYDPSDTSSAYTSQTAYNRLTKVREVATKLRGPDYDVASEPLDHELVMIAGEGKKHGKEAIAGDMFPRSSTRTLAEHKARLGLPKSFVCERATPARAEMEVFYTSPSTYAFCNSYIMLDLKMRL